MSSFVLDGPPPVLVVNPPAPAPVVVLGAGPAPELVLSEVQAPALLISPPGLPGPQGVPGPPGPAGGPAGQPRYTGTGPPGLIIGAEPGDEYLDNSTGIIYQLV